MQLNLHLMEIKELLAEVMLLDWILLGLFLLAFIIQLSYYLGVFLKLPKHKPEKKRKSRKPVSVIVCAKNEVENLKRFLPKLLEQDYPDFELIVVNDSSSDETEMFLSELSTKYKALRYTTIPGHEKFLHGKKLALTIGIKAAI